MVTSYQIVACRVFERLGVVRRKFANAGEIAGYLEWGLATFEGFRPVSRREFLWEEIAKLLGDKPVRGFEFGVAWGYCSAWWLRRMESKAFLWDGFDRFTGLPRGWRDLPEGAFDAQGKPPAINDSRVTWHIGDVQDRFSDLSLNRVNSERWLVVFDLDIYEPSVYVWDRIRGALQPGDVLYFDEAFDRDERHLLVHSVLPSGRFRLIGATPMALALEVVELSEIAV